MASPVLETAKLADGKTKDDVKGNRHCPNNSWHPNKGDVFYCSRV
jgi:hypothetical protein